MFVATVLFFSTVSQAIDMARMEYLEDTKDASIANDVTTVLNLYKRNNFHVKVVNADIQYEHYTIDNDAADDYTTFNWCAAKEHVPCIEGNI